MIPKFDEVRAAYGRFRFGNPNAPELAVFIAGMQFGVDVCKQTLEESREQPTPGSDSHLDV